VVLVVVVVVVEMRELLLLGLMSAPSLTTSDHFSFSYLSNNPHLQDTLL
jgi:hypothetical protein